MKELPDFQTGGCRSSRSLPVREWTIEAAEGGCYNSRSVGSLRVGKDRQAPTPYWAGCGATGQAGRSLLRLTVCKASASSPEGASAEWEEREGGKGGKMGRREGEEQG